MQAFSGIFLVNKPAGIGSTPISNRLKWLLKQITQNKGIKVGHGGTLDPFATGVLPIAVGSATKLLPHLLTAPKTYTFTLALGTATTTGDHTGTPIAPILPPSPVIANHRHPIASPIATLTTTQISQVLNQFLGPITQIPPAFSALKVGGRRAYSLARQGLPVTLAPRQVTIYNIDIIDIKSESLQLSAHVSKGTYIRTLGEDIAKALGTVGHLTQLSRIHHGPFSLTQCVDDQTLDNALQTSQWQSYLVPLSTLTALLAGQSPDVEPSKRAPKQS